MATSIQGHSRGDLPAEQSRIGSIRGYTAFTLGRDLNRLRWLLEQAVFFDEALPGDEAAPLLKKLIDPIRILVRDPAAAEIERLIFEQIDVWNSLFQWEEEDFRFEDTFKEYKRRAEGGEVDEWHSAFHDVTDYGRSITESIRNALLEALGDREPLKSAVNLGLLVDQGIHPRNSMRFVFRWETISGWRQPRRLIKQRADEQGIRQVAQDRVNLPSAPPASAVHVEDDEESDEPSPLAVRRFTSRSRIVARAEPRLVARFCPTADAPDPGWQFDLRMQWHAMSRWYQMAGPASLPRALLDLPARDSIPRGLIARIVKLVDKAAEVGFAHQTGRSQRLTIPVSARASDAALPSPNPRSDSGLDSGETNSRVEDPKIIAAKTQSDEGWIVASRRTLNTALGKSKTYPDYLERQRDGGVLKLQKDRPDGKYAIRINDPDHHNKVKAKIDSMRREQG